MPFVAVIEPTRPDHRALYGAAASAAAAAPQRGRHFRWFPLESLVVCGSCVELLPPHRVREELDTFYCPSCSDNMASAEASTLLARCKKCFVCPQCSATLKYVSGIVHDDSAAAAGSGAAAAGSGAGAGSSGIEGDPDASYLAGGPAAATPSRADDGSVTAAAATSTAAADGGSGSPQQQQQQQMRVFLICGFCKWSSLSVGLHDLGPTNLAGTCCARCSPALNAVQSLTEHPAAAASWMNVDPM